MKKWYGVLAICSASCLSVLVGCGVGVEELQDEELVLKSSESSLSCALYSENFDDGVANEITSGAYRVRWCNTYLPGAINTPPCLSGQTLRTNSSTINPTIWVNKGSNNCTGVRVDYNYYQFALANVTLSYRQSNDLNQVCPQTSLFTTAASHFTTQACMQQSVVIPFGSSSGVYVRFQHGSGTNAMWLDDITLTLEGCSSC
jgi:hypothetical protein